MATAWNFFDVKITLRSDRGGKYSKIGSQSSFGSKLIFDEDAAVDIDDDMVIKR
jgi:hypothetical protein